MITNSDVLLYVPFSFLINDVLSTYKRVKSEGFEEEKEKRKTKSKKKKKEREPNKHANNGACAVGGWGREVDYAAVVHSRAMRVCFFFFKFFFNFFLRLVHEVTCGPTYDGTSVTICGEA